MLTRLYVEPLLADPYLTDQVWELWDQDTIDDLQTTSAWLGIITSSVIRPGLNG